MTRVIAVEKEGYMDFTVIGHAKRTDEEVGNILCAAISILSQTLVQCLWDLEQADCETMIKDGYVRVRCRMDGKTTEIFDVIKTGFLLLKSRHSEHFDLVGEFWKTDW